MKNLTNFCKKFCESPPWHFFMNTSFFRVWLFHTWPWYYQQLKGDSVWSQKKQHGNDQIKIIFLANHKIKLFLKQFNFQWLFYIRCNKYRTLVSFSIYLWNKVSEFCSKFWAINKSPIINLKLIQWDC
jgi:hypothetical protein